MNQTFRVFLVLAGLGMSALSIAAPGRGGHVPDIHTRPEIFRTWETGRANLEHVESTHQVFYRWAAMDPVKMKEVDTQLTRLKELDAEFKKIYDMDKRNFESESTQGNLKRLLGERDKITNELVSKLGYGEVATFRDGAWTFNFTGKKIDTATETALKNLADVKARVDALAPASATRASVTKEVADIVAKIRNSSPDGKSEIADSLEAYYAMRMANSPNAPSLKFAHSIRDAMDKIDPKDKAAAHLLLSHTRRRADASELAQMEGLVEKGGNPFYGAGRLAARFNNLHSLARNKKMSDADSDNFIQSNLGAWVRAPEAVRKSFDEAGQGAKRFADFVKDPDAYIKKHLDSLSPEARAKAEQEMKDNEGVLSVLCRLCPGSVKKEGAACKRYATAA